jgi:hypothetical protein
MSDLNPSWLALLSLGAGHGINPAMGWLFAVALGLQRQNRGAVWGALGPLAAGHALAIAAAIVLAGMVGLIVPVQVVKWLTAGLLIGLGGYRLLRARHITLREWGGMSVNRRELMVWSFLMASGHGAGLMVLPLVVGRTAAGLHAHDVVHVSVAGFASVEWSGVLAALIHTAGYLLVTGLLAVVVYEKVGVRFLRKAWVNLDLIWTVALLVTGVATVMWL